MLFGVVSPFGNQTRKLTVMLAALLELADELAALDTANIISGPRTRGKKIDFRKASEEAGGDDDDVRCRLTMLVYVDARPA